MYCDARKNKRTRITEATKLYRTETTLINGETSTFHTKDMIVAVQDRFGCLLLKQGL